MSNIYLNLTGYCEEVNEKLFKKGVLRMICARGDYCVRGDKLVGTFSYKFIVCSFEISFSYSYVTILQQTWE